MAGECQCSHEAELATLVERSRTQEENIIALFDKHDQLIKKLDLLIPAVARLEVKSGFYGFIGGLIPVLIALGIALVAK
jgi:hypothetical protein